MATYVPRTVTVPVALDAEVLAKQLAILRTLCSQIGFALDSAILALQASAHIDGDVA